MTATTAPAAGRASPPARGRTLNGTALLVRLGLRRDRLRLPLWLLGITALVPFFSLAAEQAVGTPEALRATAQWVDLPVMAVFAGPLYGWEELTVQRYFMAYMVEFLLLAALMSILLVARHTRAEEQTGRAELVRAGVVGRHAPLTAALLIAGLADAGLGALIALAMAGLGYPVGSALLSGAGAAACGLAFAAVTALAAQLTESSRLAAGLGGLALAVAWALRAAGVLQDPEGGALTWLSPMAWPQLTRVMADERWWPLALSAAFAAACAAGAYALAARRDFGAGLLALRPGRRRAARWVASPLALVARLQRTSLLWWAAVMFTAGLVYGSFAGPMQGEQSAREIIGGGADVVGGYVSLTAVMMAFVVGAYAVLAVYRLRTEERRGRADAVLATAAGRAAWAGSGLLVAAGGAAGLLALNGLGLGITTAATTGEGAALGESVAAALARVPEVLVLLALAAALYGLAPRALWTAWVVLGYGVVMRFWTDPLDLPTWLMNTSPFQPAPRVPLEEFRAAPLLILTALALALAAVALAAFRRRDLEG